jgi:curved DNA-binding protein CbpA
MNPYAVLGVHAGQSNEEIRAAYLALARKHHPDRGGDTDTFATIASAYAAVRDTPRRELQARRWAVLATRCKACGGDGYTRTSKGYTRAELAGCAPCGGAGYLL